MPRTKLWKYRAGGRGHRITVFETRAGGVLQARAWDPERGKYVRKSLGHRDRDRAQAWALEEARRLKDGRAELTAETVTVARLLTLYAEHKTPRKSVGQQGEDRRRVEMWARVLGGQQDARTIPLRKWEAYIDGRLSGAIDARGRAVSKANRKPVSVRAVEADCKWLRWVCNWGANWWEGESYLLPENPIRGFKPPVVKNVRRPVASADRYERVRAVSDRVVMRRRRAYLSEILDLAYATGRRLSAILNLRYADYLPDATDELGHPLPYGAIRWRGEHDKQGKEWVAPCNTLAQQAIERIRGERPGLGDAPMFPNPTNPSEPISRYRPDRWLRKAETLAGLEPQDGSLWHAYRRGWATARKHLPATDVAHAGGWKSTGTLQACYLHADMATMLTVVTEPAEIRERQA